MFLIVYQGNSSAGTRGIANLIESACGGLTGTVAGAVYGEKAIPTEWLAKLKRRDYLEKVAERFQQIDHSSYLV